MLTFRSIEDVETVQGLVSDDVLATVMSCMADIVSKHDNLISGYVPDEHGFLVLFDKNEPPTHAQLVSVGISMGLSNPFAITVEEVEDLGNLWAVTSVVTQECSMTYLVSKGTSWLPAWLVEEIEDAVGSGIALATADNGQQGEVS